MSVAVGPLQCKGEVEQGVPLPPEIGPPVPIREVTPMLLYKLTSGNGRTMGGTLWGPGVLHNGSDPPGYGDPYESGTPGTEIEIFNPDIIRIWPSRFVYAYSSSDLALLFNPGQCSFMPPRLWEAAGVVAHVSWDEVRCHSLMTIRELPLPEWYLHRRWQATAEFARLCVDAALILTPKEAAANPSTCFLMERVQSQCADVLTTLNIRGGVCSEATYEVAYVAASTAMAAAAVAGCPIDFVALAERAAHKVGQA